MSTAGARRRLRALVAIGWTRAQLADRLQLTRGQLAGVLDRSPVTPATEQAARGLYEQLWNCWPTGPIAERTRRMARRRGWAVPMAWDDDLIDDPAAGAAERWQRPERTRWTAAALAHDAAELIAQGHTRAQAAARLGVSKNAVDQAFIRTQHPAPRRTRTMPPDQTTTFDPVPRSAPEQVKGAAFASEMVLRQADAGLGAEVIQARHDAAVATLTAAARTDGEREFLAGFRGTGQDRIDTLRVIERAEREAAAWERDAEREAG
jgi:hypothetical protein